MKNYGNTGQAVTCTNEPTFEGFVTKSGRTIEDDLARARAPFVSPIKLRPLDPAAERALISGSRAPRAPRKPARPARPPAPRPAARQQPAEVMTPRPMSAGGGQTTREDHAMTVATGCSHAQLLAWAEEHPRAQIRARGARLDRYIREMAALRQEDLHAAAERAQADRERQDAARQVEALRQQLREAEARLRPARRTPPPGVDLQPGESTPKIRRWAMAQGHQVSVGGRLPQHIIDAYRAAQVDVEQTA